MLEQPNNNQTTTRTTTRTTDSASGVSGTSFTIVQFKGGFDSFCGQFFIFPSLLPSFRPSRVSMALCIVSRCKRETKEPKKKSTPVSCKHKSCASVFYSLYPNGWTLLGLFRFHRSLLEPNEPAGPSQWLCLPPSLISAFIFCLLKKRDGAGRSGQKNLA